MTRGQIENRNFLSPTGFKFTLTRTPKVAFFCNQANIPDINLGVAVQPSYTKMLPTPGDILEFGDLNLTFLVDENLENYMEIQNWMRGLGFPESLKQFSDLENANIPTMLSKQRYANSGQNIYSDGTLQVLTSGQIPNFQVLFKDIFPYSLSTLDFDATNTDIQYFTASVSFKYTIYNIVDLQGNPLYEY